MNKITLNEFHKFDILEINFGHIHMATRNVPNASPLAYAAMQKWPLLSINIEGNQLFAGGKTFTISNEILQTLNSFNKTGIMQPISLLVEYGN